MNSHQGKFNTPLAVSTILLFIQAIALLEAGSPLCVAPGVPSCHTEVKLI
jgi:hypothetical protein